MESDQIREKLYKWLELDFRFSNTPKLVISEDGAYQFANFGDRVCYPLEGFLLTTQASGDWHADVMKILHVNQEWMAGFHEVFTGTIRDDADVVSDDYIQGFFVAEYLVYELLKGDEDKILP